LGAAAAKMGRWQPRTMRDHDPMGKLKCLY
jgi:hypothetical protein